MSAKKITKGPNWQFEAGYSGPVAGIDEVGRGPLAGPVVACAVILREDHIPAGLNDSKKLSEAHRESLYTEIMKCALVGIGIAEPADIDRLNIRGATFAAMRRALADLPAQPIAALVDGNADPGLGIQTQCIIKGDAKSLSIAAASIIAKVTRDRLMIAVCKRYPAYGLSGHKGYPTAAHRAAVIARGPCPNHRASFAPVKAALLRE